MNYDYKIYQDRDTLSRGCAELFIERAQTAITERGAFHVALAGGSTPKGIYRQLGRPEVAEGAQWQNIALYLGDERYVPIDHPDSNALMVRKTLLDPIALPPVLHTYDTQRSAAEAARAYSDILSHNLPRDGQANPQFDLILLGMGDDGHTASLFPDSSIIDEQSLMVAAVYVEKLSSWRISLTLPTINRAREVWIIVSGSAKASLVGQIFNQQVAAQHYPVQRLTPRRGVTWHLDRDAAAKLY